MNVFLIKVLAKFWRPLSQGYTQCVMLSRQFAARGGWFLSVHSRQRSVPSSSLRILLVIITCSRFEKGLEGERVFVRATRASVEQAVTCLSDVTVETQQSISFKKQRDYILSNHNLPISLYSHVFIKLAACAQGASDETHQGHHHRAGEGGGRYWHRGRGVRSIPLPITGIFSLGIRLRRTR